MMRKNSLGVGMAIGVLMTAAAGLLMAQAGGGDAKPANDAIVGVTGYEIDGTHIAVAWTREGKRLRAVAGGTLTPLELATKELEAPGRPDDQAKLSAQLKKIQDAKDPAAKKAEILNAKNIISANGNCPGCEAALDRCLDNGGDLEACFGRYIICVLRNCH